MYVRKYKELTILYFQMDDEMGFLHDTEKVGLDSPTAREIIGTMNIQKPISTQRFLDKFIQVRVYAQKTN